VDKEEAIPVITGLAVGIGFVFLFSITFGHQLAISTVPTLPEAQAMEIVKEDLKHKTGNVTLTVYLQNGRVPLLYYRLEDNIALRINETSHEIMSSCVPSIECFLPNNIDLLRSIGGRLVYFIDGIYSGVGTSAPTFYYVDAATGDILWSYIGENANP